MAYLLHTPADSKVKFNDGGSRQAGTAENPRKAYGKRFPALPCRYGRKRRRKAEGKKKVEPVHERNDSGASPAGRYGRKEKNGETALESPRCASVS